MPECELLDGVAAQLPDRSAPAPWETRVQALLWFHRASPAAAAQLPAQLRGERALPITIGGFIRYLDTPVGPYSEVLASPLLLARPPLPAAFVPFIAVDSLASIHGGRANWALPKTLAAFEWSAPPEQLGTSAFRIRAEGTHGPSSWSVDAAVAPRRRGLPVRFPLRDLQLTPDGRELDIPMTVRGRAQLATIELTSRGPSLPQWLLSGRHQAVFLPAARMTFGAPRR